MCPAIECSDRSQSETAVPGSCAALADVGRPFGFKIHKLVGQSPSTSSDARGGGGLEAVKRRSAANHIALLWLRAIYLVSFHDIIGAGPRPHETRPRPSLPPQTPRRSRGRHYLIVIAAPTIS